MKKKKKKKKMTRGKVVTPQKRKTWYVFMFHANYAMKSYFNYVIMYTLHIYLTFVF